MNDSNITRSPLTKMYIIMSHICIILVHYLLSINLCVVSSFRHIMKPITVSSKILLINGLVQNVNAIYVLI